MLHLAVLAAVEVVLHMEVLPLVLQQVRGMVIPAQRSKVILGEQAQTEVAVVEAQVLLVLLRLQAALALAATVCNLV
jgi:hypothetical protein